MKLLFTWFALCSLLLLPSCQSAKDTPSNPIPNESQKPEITFNFDNDAESWKGDFVDLPMNYQESGYEVLFQYEDIPITGSESKGLMLSGLNKGDHLFLYLYRKIGTVEGLEPNTPYSVDLSFDLATNLPAVTEALGESVFIKAGIVTIKPQPQEENEEGVSVIRLNLDKGVRETDGQDLKTLGNAVKVQSNTDTYQYKKLEQTFEVTTGATSETWVIIGIDSYVQEKIKLYLDNIRVLYTKQ